MRKSFNSLLVENGLASVKFFKGTKRAYCWVNNVQYIVGERTSISSPMYVVEGSNGGLFLSNNQSASEAQVIGEVAVTA